LTIAHQICKFEEKSKLEFLIFFLRQSFHWYCAEKNVEGFLKKAKLTTERFVEAALKTLPRFRPKKMHCVLMEGRHMEESKERNFKSQE
jgi:hypothetical protein